VQTANKIKTKTAKQNTRDWRLSSWQEAKYYKTALRVHGSVRASHSFACIARVGNPETQAFDAISI